jgi:hypothetical protein
MLSDGTRCKVMMVTTPAFTPVTETVEVANSMVETVGVVMAPTVVNKCDAHLSPTTTTSNNVDLANAYAYALQRYEAQVDAIALLSSLRDDKQLHLPRHSDEGATLVSLLAADLARAFGELL